MAKSSKLILVAEDETVYAEIYKIKLEKEGFRVITCSNGRELIALLEKETPDLIILDLVMPLLDGFETLKKIKSRAKTKDIPVIVLSNLSKDVDITQAKELGAADYYVKTNVSVHELAEAVKKYIRT